MTGAILVPDTVFADDGALERAAALPYRLELGTAQRVEDLDGRFAEAAAIVAYHKIAYDRALAERARACRILVRVGVGHDNVDLAAWAERGIPVCNVPDYGTSEIADHALALLLALSRGLLSYHDAIRRDPVGGWRPMPMPLQTRRLRGARLLIVGLGNIGMALALRAKALEMRVGFHGPSRPAGIEIALGLDRFDDLRQGLAEADIVSLHLPLSDVTRRMFDRDLIAAMKPGALLINTARGDLVDLEALCEALRTGHLGGAALDVVPHEPPDPDNALFRALIEDPPWIRGRVIVTPHVAWASPEAMRDIRVKSIETARDYLTDGTLRSCLNRSLL